MRIFVMRHGQAQAMASSDQSRELTAYGKNEVEHMANRLVQQKLQFDVIYVSPYIRAQQTALIVKNTLTASPSLTTLDFITPEDSAKQMHDYIDGSFDDNNDAIKNVLIVSHMPLVSYLVAEFTNGQHAPLFQTASVAEIDYDLRINRGQLTAHIAPAEL